MREYRTWEEILMERFTSDWEEAIGYLDVALEEYQEDGDTPFFLQGLQNVVEARGGIAEVAKKIGMVPQLLSDMLSGEEALRIDTFSSILTALGCRLSIQPLEVTECSTEPVAGETSIVSSELSSPSSEVSIEKR